MIDPTPRSYPSRWGEKRCSACNLVAVRVITCTSLNVYIYMIIYIYLIHFISFVPLRRFLNLVLCRFPRNPNYKQHEMFARLLKFMVHLFVPECWQVRTQSYWLLVSQVVARPISCLQGNPFTIPTPQSGRLDGWSRGTCCCSCLATGTRTSRKTGRNFAVGML